LRRLILVLLVVGIGTSVTGGSALGAARATTPSWWAGLWQTDFGLMKLNQTGAAVSGHYGSGLVHSIKGSVNGKTFSGIWTEGTATGKAVFTISADGSTFTGKYGRGAEPVTSAWSGKNLKHAAKPVAGSKTGTTTTKAPVAVASFAGVWTTDFGVMNIKQTGAAVTGKYGTDQTNTIVGTVTGRALRGTWKEGDRTGKIRFTISTSGKSFTGVYGTGAEPPLTRWNGTKT
jgi:hypothetical protein